MALCAQCVSINLNRTLSRADPLPLTLPGDSIDEVSEVMYGILCAEMSL